MKKYKIGYTTGVFDLFHIGHLNILKKAKEQCEYLIVGVSLDNVVMEYKQKKPIICFEERIEIVKAIKYVDEVVPQVNMNKFAAWEKLHFNVIFHGDDWKNSDMYDKYIKQFSQVGVDVVFLPHTAGISSTKLTPLIYKILEEDGEYQLLQNLTKKVDRLIPLIKELDELFYFTSENNQLLKSLNESLVCIKQKRNDKKESSIEPMYHFDDSWSENNPVICHALGEIDGIRFTECKEAFLYHYAKGSRVFEVDFSLTCDEIPVVLHDWETLNYGEMSGKRVNNQDKAMSNEEFVQLKILGKYTPLTLERFIQIAEEYKDTRFIISVKSVNQNYDANADIIFSELFAKSDAIDPAIKKRFILHAYSVEFLHKTMEKHKFASVIYRVHHTLHPQILAEELKKLGITTVTIIDRWYVSLSHCRIFHENGIKIILCIVQDGNKEIKKFLADGVDMIMSPQGEDIKKLF